MMPRLLPHRAGPAGRVAVLLVLAAAAAASGQNVVDDSPETRRAEPTQVKAEDVEALVRETPDFAARPRGSEAARAAAKLNAHVAALVAGYPWKAFHNTLGISGYEAYFNHPDGMFYALSIALPQVRPETAAATKRLLAQELPEFPPFAVTGFANLEGQAREAYDVPAGVRLSGRGKAASAFGVYAFWAYVHWAGAADAVKPAWDALRERMQPVLDGPYAFDPANAKYVNDEAQRLTGDLAGLVGLARLARLAGDAETGARARARARELLELRVNLERTNPRILEATRSASKSLHISKLARYCDLAPEVGRTLDRLSEGVGRTRVTAFREARNAWYLAFSERMIGGENWVSPPHLGRALMTTATFLEDLPADRLLMFLDVPWCQADFYFVEKCAYALWAAGGRPWKPVE